MDGKILLLLGFIIYPLTKAFAGSWDTVSDAYMKKIICLAARQPFFSPPSIAHATFLGHALDSYKAPFEEQDGLLTVKSNALDHIFLKDLKVIFSVREAGVYDEKGHIIDPYTNTKIFLQRLEERKTASDHFLNAVLFCHV